MTAKEKPKIPLPKDWTGNVRSAVLHVIGLAQYATAYTRSSAIERTTSAPSTGRRSPASSVKFCVR